MAQKVVVELFDDLDGSVAVETLTFALDGRSYEIDLSEKNASALRKVFAPYTEVGRKQGGPRRGAKRVAAARGSNRPDPSEVRAWAESQGIEVASRGRVPGDVVEKFQAAH
jgi:Lsr2